MQLSYGYLCRQQQYNTNTSLRVQFPVTFQVPAMHVVVYGVPVPLKVQLLLHTPPEGTLLQALPLANSQLPPFAAAGGAESQDLTASVKQGNKLWRPEKRFNTQLSPWNCSEIKRRQGDE
jgi:hypothetical protein